MVYKYNIGMEGPTEPNTRVGERLYRPGPSAQAPMATKARLAPSSLTFEHGLFPPQNGAGIAPSRLLALGRDLGPLAEVHALASHGADSLGLSEAHMRILVGHFQALHLHRTGEGAGHVPTRKLLLFLFAQTYQYAVVRSPVKTQEEVGDLWPSAQDLRGDLRSAVQQPSARSLAVQARSGRRLGEVARDRLTWLARHSDFILEVLCSCGLDGGPALRGQREGAGRGGVVAGGGAEGGSAVGSARTELRAADVDELGVILEVAVTAAAAGDVRAPSHLPPSRLLPSLAASPGAAVTPERVAQELAALLAEGASASASRSPRLSAALSPGSPGATCGCGPLPAGVAAIATPPTGAAGRCASAVGGAGTPATPTPATAEGPPKSPGSAGSPGAVPGFAIVAEEDPAASDFVRTGILVAHACGGGGAGDCKAGSSASVAAEPAAEPGYGGLGERAAAGGVAGTHLHVAGLHRRTQLIDRAAIETQPGEDATLGCDVQLIDCHQSFIYVLAPVRSVLVLGCTKCTLVFGAVERVATFEHCERVRVHATAGAFRVANSMECSFCLCVNRQPVLTGENHRLTFAPFDTHYARLGVDMAAAGVDPRLAANCWARAIAFSTPMAPLSSATASLLPPERFLPFTVPFEFGGDTQSNPCELPERYLEALVTARARLVNFQNELTRVASTAAVREEVQAAVHRRFKEWLVKSGNMRQVHDLMLLDASGTGASALGGGNSRAGISPDSRSDTEL